MSGIADAIADGAALCLGIDPHESLLSEWGLPATAEGARELGLRAVDAAAGRVRVVKPQIAFFERYGSAGYAALESVIGAARAAGLLVLADVKRGDMGTSFASYAESWLAPGSPLEADAMTLVAYQGTGVLARAYELALAHGKTVFVLSATSNPESASVQTAILPGGRTVAAGILEDMESRNAAVGDGIGPFGVVIGATNRLADFGLNLDAAVRTPVLAPGFGAQGAALRDLRAIYGASSGRVLASVSRSALDAGPDGLAIRLDALRAELADGSAS